MKMRLSEIHAPNNAPWSTDSTADSDDMNVRIRFAY